MIQLAQFDLETTREYGESLLYDSNVIQTDRAASIPY